jgi:hypothetical protein
MFHEFSQHASEKRRGSGRKKVAIAGHGVSHIRLDSWDHSGGIDQIILLARRINVDLTHDTTGRSSFTDISGSILHVHPHEQKVKMEGPATIWRFTVQSQDRVKDGREHGLIVVDDAKKIFHFQ